MALIPTGRRFGIATADLEREIGACFERLAAARRRCEDRDELRGAIQNGLRQFLGPANRSDGSRLEASQDLLRAFVLPRRRGAFLLARILLHAGFVGEARRFAGTLQDRGLRYRVTRLARSGVWTEENRRIFVGDPFDDEASFEDGLPRFLAMARTSCATAALGEARRRRAESLLRSLDRRSRQTALAYWSVVAYHASGLESGLGVRRSIRYRSRREHAGFLLVHAALEAGRLDEAWRLFDTVGRGAWRERAGLILAAALIARRRLHRARRVLCGVEHVSRQAERALLSAEIDRLRGDVPRCLRGLVDLRLAPWAQAEDMALFIDTLPSLRDRGTLLNLRCILDGEVGPGERSKIGHEILGQGDLRSLIRDRRAIRLFLADVAAGGLDLGSVLRSLQQKADVFEPIRSESISCRAAALSEGSEAPGRASVSPTIGAALLQGLHAGPVEWRRAQSLYGGFDDPARCAFDEGVSLSPGGALHRKALVRAAKACLKRWLRRPPFSSEALRSRLRILLNFGDELACRQLVRVLEAATEPGAVDLAAFSTLIALDARRAARLYFQDHAGRLSASPRATRAIVAACEERRVLEPGFTRLWMRLVGVVTTYYRRDPAGWIDELTSAWFGESTALPSCAAVRCLLHDLGRDRPAAGGELVERSRKRLAHLATLPPGRLVQTLLDDPVDLKRLLWLRPPSLPRSHRPWSEPWWKNVLGRLGSDFGTIDETAVAEWARRLTDHPRAARRLRSWLLGELPGSCRKWSWRLPGEASPSARWDYRLRYLDKAADLLSFLRFADCVPCCFNSASTWYRDSDFGYWVLTLWKDPLSFCFHVECRESAAGGWQPRGFVFGGYGVADDEPAVVLNGVYLKNQHPPLREAILATIETRFCRPLGVRRIGIANEYRGRGALPPDFVRRQVELRRLRALKKQGRPVRRIYDDVSATVNAPVRVGHLYWKSNGAA